MRRNKTIKTENGERIHYTVTNNPNYIKGESCYTTSCSKYIISIYDNQRNGWVQVGYCNTLNSRLSDYK